MNSKPAPARWSYLAGGYALFALGILGIVLPLLPTTVFWIGAAACFAKSSPEMYQRIVSWPKVGPIVNDFLAHGVISSTGKKAALIGMGLCAALIGLLAFGTWAMVFSWVGISIAAAIVLSRPSLRPVASFKKIGESSRCPFLVAVRTPFPMLASMTSADPFSA